MGCKIEIAGTAFQSVRYHLSRSETSFPIVTKTSLNNASSLLTTYVGIGLKVFKSVIELQYMEDRN